MQDPPPRRTRRRPPRSEGSVVPLIPLLIGVVVLGFVIGAGLSVFGKRDATLAPAPQLPAAEATLAPAPASPVPPEPLPSPSARASPRPSRAAGPRLRSSAAPAAARSAQPAVAPTRTAPAVNSAAAPSASPAAAAPTTVSSAIPSVPASDATAATTGTPVATALPSATAVAASAAPASVPAVVAVSGATTPFARLAANVVRVYLAAVARGDRTSAAAELATPPSGPLVEDGIVAAGTQVRALAVHGTGDIVTVDAELGTAGGAYSAEFTVQRSTTGAALIIDHSIVKSATKTSLLGLQTKSG